MAPTLSISYTLSPPASTTSPAGLSSTTTHEFTVKSEPNVAGGHAAYYVALRDAVEESKEVLGKELTAWRDAVGDGEKDRTGKIREDLDDDAEGEEEGEEDV